MNGPASVSHSTPLDPSRRRVLQFGSFAAVLPMAPVLQAGLPAVQHAAPSEAYSGPGYYLFPHWGEPTVYHVSEDFDAPAAEPRLAFRNPHDGTLLWSQSLHGEALFAGKLVGPPA